MPTLPLTPLEQKAWTFAKQAHKGVVRKFLNVPYFEGHVAKVFGILKQYDTRPTLGAAAILHDTLEDVDYVTFDLIKDKFGSKVANLVQELTSDEGEIKKHGKANYLLNKMSYMSDDALLIKLCDRLQNISDMYAASIGFRSKYYKETKFIIDGLKNNRRLLHKHSRIINQIEGLLQNIKNRNKFESKMILNHLVLFEDFKVNNIDVKDILKTIDNGGVIYATIIDDLPGNDPKQPLRAIDVDEDGTTTVELNNKLYNVKLKNIQKIEYENEN